MRVKISDFLAYFTPRAAATTQKASLKPPADQDGYSMGATGETATEENLRRMAKIYQPDTWEAYYNRTKRWIGRRVWDCNGLAEGFYKDKTGVSINTKARSNYANWCGRKSPAAADEKLTGMPQMPGVAVFSGPSASGITHVGFLLRKIGPGPLDWEVLEAKGADYGVVITPLKAGKWRWWGVMDRYFEYDAEEVPAQEKGGGDVFYAVCTGSSVNIRTGRSASFTSIGKLDKGAKLLAAPEVLGWCEVAASVGGRIVAGYVSKEYVKEAGSDG